VAAVLGAARACGAEQLVVLSAGRAALGGVRTSLPATDLSAEAAVTAYKGLAVVA
jgi:hypothetical protein